MVMFKALNINNSNKYSHRNIKLFKIYHNHNHQEYKYNKEIQQPNAVQNVDFFVQIL